MIFRKKSKAYSAIMYPVALLLVFWLSSFLLVSCQAQNDIAVQEEDKIEYLTQIDTVITFDPTTFVESVETVKYEVEIHSIVDSRPVLKGCESSGDNDAQSTCSEIELLQLVTKNIQFPKGQKVDGIVYMKFLIDDGGFLSKPSIIKSLSPAYDKEVLRMFQQLQDSTKWSPAKVDGKAVGFYYTLPIKFKFD